MLIEELPLKAARNLCADYSNGYWCDGCPFVKCCLKTYVMSPGPDSLRIGKAKVPDSVVDKLWEEGKLY